MLARTIHKIYGAYAVFLAGKSPNIRSYTVYIYGSGQPYLQHTGLNKQSLRIKIWHLIWMPILRASGSNKVLSSGLKRSTTCKHKINGIHRISNTDTQADDVDAVKIVWAQLSVVFCIKVGMMSRFGQHHIYAMYIRYFWQGKITKYTVKYGKYIRFWPTLVMRL